MGKGGKTAGRAPVGAAKRETPGQLADAAASNPSRRVVPLGGGTWAYLVDPLTGLNRHRRVLSPAFRETVLEQAALSPAYRGRLASEIFSISYGDFPAAWALLAPDLAGENIAGA